MPIPPSTNCKSGEFGNTLLNNQNNESNYLQFNCFECSLPYVEPTLISPNNEIDNICSFYNNITGCVEYDLTNTLAQTNYSCLRCDTLKYITNQGYNCTKRENVDINCSSYNLKEDKCVTCSVGYFLNVLQTECIKNPDGDIGCTQYMMSESKRICTACDTTNYIF